MILRAAETRDTLVILQAWGFFIFVPIYKSEVDLKFGKGSFKSLICFLRILKPAP